MSFGEGDLHGRVEELERENARLREVCEANVASAIREGAETLREVKGRMEVTEKVNRQLRKRAAMLESLVADMYESMRTVSEAWAYDLYHDRMVELGIDVEGGA